MLTIGVVADVNLFVDAAYQYDIPDLTRVRTPPPADQRNAYQQCLRALLDGTLDGHRALQLYVSRHILKTTRVVLCREPLRWEPGIADEYVSWILHELAGGPQRGHLEPQSVPALCPDPEDDHVLALARASGADVLVTSNLQDLEGVPEAASVEVMTPHRFVAWVDAERRAAGWRAGSPPSPGQRP